MLCKRLQTDSAVCWHEALSGTSRESWMAAWGAIVYRDVPFGGLQIAAYREAHDHLATPMLAVLGASLPDSASDCLAGLVAGACAAALTTPLDVVVTRAATAPPTPAGAHAPSPLEHGVRLVEEEGLASLTRGIGARTLYYAWVTAAFFGLYEALRRTLEAHGF